MSDTTSITGRYRLRSGRRPVLRFFLLGLVFLFMAIILHWYQPNMGGSGLSLPFNITAWMLVCLVMTAVLLWPLRRRRLRLSKAFIWFFCGMLILIALSLTTRAVWRENAALTTAGMIGSLSFYLVLLQLRIRLSARYWLLMAILLAVVLECLLSLIQFFHLPAAARWEFSDQLSARPYGIFQQINVLASFVATGIALLFYLCFASTVPSPALTGRFNVGRQIACIFLFMLFGVTLQLCQSQIGYLATLVAVLCYCCWFSQQRTKLLWTVGALAAGILIGKAMQLWMLTPSITHIQSSHIRLMFIIDSLRMFSEKPLFGWGIGGFEYSFLHRFGGEETFIAQGAAAHPHNEILLWMVEGGIVGLLGIAAIIYGGVIIVKQAYRQKKLPFLTLTFPVLLHMMTEYPIYQSVPHWLILLLLLRCVDMPRCYCNVPGPVMWGGRALLGAGAAASFVLLAAAYPLQERLTHTEREGRQAQLPLSDLSVGETLLSDRYQFDMHIGDLLRFNQTGDKQWLLHFERWAERYSEVHPDANVYATRMGIARHFGDTVRLAELQKQGRWLFPGDPRFADE